jgi:alkaline phosphatase D
MGFLLSCLLRLLLWYLLTADSSAVNLLIGVALALLLPHAQGRRQPLGPLLRALWRALVAVPQAYGEALALIGGGREQERWLEQSLARQDTAQGIWSVIAQQTVFGQRDFRPGAGEVLTNDGWDGYSAARTRLTDALQRHRVPNPVVLGGDLHANWVGHVKADYARPSSASVGVEFCGTSITSRGGGNAQMPRRLAENPHFVFADAREHGYGVTEFTPTHLRTRLRVVDDVTRRETGIRTLAAFEVAAGRSVLERSA